MIGDGFLNHLLYVLSLFILYSCIKQILIIPSSVLIELNLIKCNSTLTERGARCREAVRGRGHIDRGLDALAPERAPRTPPHAHSHSPALALPAIGQ